MQAVLPLRAASPFLGGVRGAAVAVGAAGRAGAAAQPGGARRAAGGGKFAAFKVKKANWVEVRALLACARGVARCSPPAGAPPLGRSARSRPPRASQSNEILRENQFFTWSLSRSNMVGVAVMALAFPLAFHYLNKAELERRDVACVAALGRRRRANRNGPRFARRGSHPAAPPRRPRALAATAAWTSPATTSDDGERRPSGY